MCLILACFVCYLAFGPRFDTWSGTSPVTSPEYSCGTCSGTRSGTKSLNRSGIRPGKQSGARCGTDLLPLLAMSVAVKV